MSEPIATPNCEFHGEGQGADTPAFPPVQVSPPLGRNFCSDCGSPWQPEWAECRVCAQRTGEAKSSDVSRPITAGPSLALYFTLLAASAVGLLVGIAHPAHAALLLGLSIAHSLIILIWTIWSWPDVMAALVRPVAPIWFAVATIAAVGTFLVATGAMRLLHWSLGVHEIRMTDALLLANWSWPAIILLICVQPAVFEELGFRGVILPSLQPMLAAREAVIVSALLFMTLHLAFASFPHLFLIGLVLGYLRARTGSLLPGMLMHFTHNLLCVVAEQRWS